jgi:hypothetical protein
VPIDLFRDDGDGILEPNSGQDDELLANTVPQCGNFRFDELPLGKYWVVAGRGELIEDGCPVWPRLVEVLANQTTSVAFAWDFLPG